MIPVTWKDAASDHSCCPESPLQPAARPVHTPDPRGSLFVPRRKYIDEHPAGVARPQLEGADEASFCGRGHRACAFPTEGLRTTQICTTRLPPVRRRRVSGNRQSGQKWPVSAGWIMRQWTKLRFVCGAPRRTIPLPQSARVAGSPSACRFPRASGCGSRSRRGTEHADKSWRPTSLDSFAGESSRSQMVATPDPPLSEVRPTQDHRPMESRVVNR